MEFIKKNGKIEISSDKTESFHLEVKPNGYISISQVKEEPKKTKD